MKDLYRKPDAALLKFAPAEFLADGESWVEEDNEGDENIDGKV